MGRNETWTERIEGTDRTPERADDLLRRLSEWDVLYVRPDGKGEPVTADAPYWQGEIARVRTEIAELTSRERSA